jgi:hypothetical protein
MLLWRAAEAPLRRKMDELFDHPAVEALRVVGLESGGDIERDE